MIEYRLTWDRAVLALVTVVFAVWFFDGSASAWVDARPNPRFALVMFTFWGLFMAGGNVISKLIGSAATWLGRRLVR